MPKFIKCKNCGEPMTVDESSEALRCEHCGKKYRNPYYKPQEVVLEEVVPVITQPEQPQETIIEEAPAPQETIIEEVPAPQPTQDLASQLSFEQPVAIQAPAISLLDTPQEPQRVVRAPKKGVSIARLIFSIIALIAIIVFNIIPVIREEMAMMNGASYDELSMHVGNTAYAFALAAISIICLVSAAVCINANPKKLKGNRSSSIVSAIFSLIAVIVAFASTGIITAILDYELEEIGFTQLIGVFAGIMLPMFIVFILSCVSASQIKKAIKNPEAYSVEVAAPAQEQKAEQPAAAPVQYTPVQAQQAAAQSTSSVGVLDAKSEFNAGLFSYIGLKLVNSLIMTFTLGLGTPWAIRREYTWLYEHQVIDGRKLEFTGKAGSLLGQWIKWIFLSIITLGIYAWLVPIKKMQWITENTHIEGVARNPEDNQSRFDGKFWSYLGERIIDSLIITCTCGICTPWAICRMERWELEHKHFDGQRLVFDGKAASLLGQWIKWLLLSFITLGIYAWWIPIKKQKWITEHTHFEA